MSDQHAELRSGHPNQGIDDAARDVLDASGSSRHRVYGEVQHLALLAEHIGRLYMNPSFADVELSVDDELIPAHRVLLASRSDYFRVLFFGGMCEQYSRRIELKETPIDAFKNVLKYIYTGKMSLSNLGENDLLDLLGVAHKYQFCELEAAVSDYLKISISNDNLCALYNTSQLYGLDSLVDRCLTFADQNAASVLSTSGFLDLSLSAAAALIARDSFCAPEIEIFRAVKRWMGTHPGVDATVLSHELRMPLIDLMDLLNEVRPSGMVPPEMILDAIKEQKEKRNSQLRHRGFQLTNTNVLTLAMSASLKSGESSAPLSIFADASPGLQDPDRSNGIRHQIEQSASGGEGSSSGSASAEGIVLQLGAAYVLNQLILQLLERDDRQFSYTVDVSVDGVDWERVADHSKHLCRGRQRINFPARVVRSIRVIGTHATSGRSFHVTAVEASFSTDAWPQDPETTLLIPPTNVATIELGAIVREGVSRCRNALINGVMTNYDWDTGYTCHRLGNGSICIQLTQPFLIESMRLLLWDCDNRFYSYYVEVSSTATSSGASQQHWVRVADRTNRECRAWQVIRFERQPVVFVRIVGTHNSANEVFHVVHFECPADRKALEEYDDRGESPPPVGGANNGDAAMADPEQDGERPQNGNDNEAEEAE